MNKKKSIVILALLTTYQSHSMNFLLDTFLFIGEAALLKSDTTPPELKLVYAARRGNFNVVKELLAAKVDANSTYETGETALHFVSRQALFSGRHVVSGNDLSDEDKPDFFEIAQLLINCGADVTKKNKYGETPLHFVAKSSFSSTKDQCSKMIALLIANGASINETNEAGETPLHVCLNWACYNDQKGLVPLFLQSGAVVSVQCNDGSSALDLALEGVGAKVFILLLNQYRREKPGDISRILITAARKSNMKIIEKLLKQDVYINVKEQDGSTALHAAAGEGSLEVVIVLIRRGAKINERNKEGATPLFVAAEKGRCEIVRALLQRSANVDVSTNIGKSPLHGALNEGHEKAAFELLKAEAALHLITTDGQTTLHLAAKSGLLKLVRFFLRNNISIEAADTRGWTALHYAAYNGKTEIVKELLAKNAIRFTADHSGLTPLAMAQQAGHTDIVKLLS